MILLTNRGMVPASIAQTATPIAAVIAPPRAPQQQPIPVNVSDWFQAEQWNDGMDT